ncbi:hypothetical protein HY772_03005 [Candidatus Woesearchaeota archaeon]|nr:hypothetical protein [Candidatus Woesearchaeota archaeon]
MNNLADLLRTGNIEVNSKGRRLNAAIPNYGEYNWDLVRHLCTQADNYVTLCGQGLEQFLRDDLKVMQLTDFLTQMWDTNREMRFHVLADIEAITTSYRKNAEQWLVNGLGDRVVSTSTWLPQATPFEKLWNLCLCSSIGGMIGYPGYEWPQTADAFEVTVAEHAQMFLIGTHQQLKRYKILAEKQPEYATEINITVDKFMQAMN